MKIVILDYNSGRAKSLQAALQQMGVDAVITADAEIISASDKVIIPGVGDAASGMQQLKESKLDELILTLNQPVLGICLGMQLMCRQSEERDTIGLGIFRVNVRKFSSTSKEIKLPHEGWGAVSNFKGPLFKNVPEGAQVFYRHQYYTELDAYTSAVTEYIHPFSAALSYENFHGVQFLPEQSGVAGEFVLRNFLEL